MTANTQCYSAIYKGPFIYSIEDNMVQMEKTKQLRASIVAQCFRRDKVIGKINQFHTAIRLIFKQF